MRARTDKQIAAMSSPYGFTTYHRVRVLVGATWHDLTNIEGRNFLGRVAWDETTEAPVAQVNIDFAPSVDDVYVTSLLTGAVPNLITSDSRPLLDKGRLFVVEAALMAGTELPGSSDWTEFFRGNLDRENAASRAQLKGRDLGAILTDTLLETEPAIGSTSGTALVTVLNSIIAASPIGSNVTVYAPTDPSFLVGPDKAKRGMVYEACAFLVDQIGWDLRYRWRAGVGFTLTLQEPGGANGRAKTTPDWTYSASEYGVVGKVETSLEEVRNRWVGVYQSRTLKDASGQPKRVERSVQDDVSISRYSPIQGVAIPRTCYIAEEHTSAIDSDAEMDRMLAAGLADYKDVTLEVDVDVPFNPFVELGDLVRLTANPRYWAADQDLAVVNVAHILEGGRGRTRLIVRGKPAMAPYRWERMSKSYNAPVLMAPLQPTVSVVTPILNGVSVAVAPAPSGPPAVRFEVHASNTSGFTPDNSDPSTTLKATAAATTLVVTTLDPAKTWYLKVVPVDVHGNRGAESAQQTVAPRYVEPRNLQPRVIPGIIPNDSFEANNVPNAPPDTWTLTSGTWGSTAFLSTSSHSGSFAIRFEGGTNNVLTSQLVTAREGDVINFEAVTMRPGASGAASLLVDWLSDETTAVRTDSVLIGQGVAGVWTRSVDASVAPASARFLRIRVNQGNISPLYVDSVRAIYARFVAEDIVRVSAVTQPPKNGYAELTTGQAAVAESAGYHMTATAEVVVAGYLQAPATTTSTVAFTLPTAYAPRRKRGFTILCESGANATAIAAEVRTNGDVYVYAALGGSLVSFDGIRFRVDQ